MFMELALNLVWVIIAVASYALLFRYLAGRGTGHSCVPSRSQCIIALTCALAILFPVISLTDDLHEMQATVEDASLSGLVLKKCAASHPSTSKRISHQDNFIFAPFATSARWAVLGVVEAERVVRPTPRLHRSAIGRAPPSFATTQIS